MNTEEDQLCRTQELLCKTIESFERLLEQSERRIDRTNDMIQNMSHSCAVLVETNKEVKDSYLLQFERVTAQSRQLLDEVEKLREEKTAYFEAVQRYRELLETERRSHQEELAKERKRYDDMMAQLVNHLCQSHSQGPVVTIDQKQN